MWDDLVEAAERVLACRKQRLILSRVHKRLSSGN
jgi:hypothetical protein